VSGTEVPVHGAVCHVRLHDVSRADAASVVVAESTVTVDLSTDGGEIPFELDVGDLDRSATYALSAHVDTTGSGEVSAGDFLTTEHHPVSPDDLQTPRRVNARRV
jgi:uncharacterized lipoprotein YbaY